MGENAQRIINQMGTCEYASLRPDCLLGDKKKSLAYLFHTFQYIVLVFFVSIFCHADL